MSTPLAFHEAGYFVVVRRHGVDVAGITIEPTGRGSVRMARKLGAYEPQDLLVSIRSVAAAETKFRGRPSSLDSRDREQAQTLAALIARAPLDSREMDDALTRYEAMAAAAVIEDWRQIERVADALTRRGRLSAADLTSLIEGGERTMHTNERETEFAREQAARVAAAAAESRAAGGLGDGGPPVKTDRPLGAGRRRHRAHHETGHRREDHRSDGAARTPARGARGAHLHGHLAAGALVRSGRPRHSRWQSLDCAGAVGRCAAWLDAFLERGRRAPRKGRGVTMPVNRRDDDIDVDDTGEWATIPLDARSTPEDLERLIAVQVRAALDSLRDPLEADPDFSPRDRAALIVRAKANLEPMIRGQIERMHASLLPIQ
jgi:hypothetical protein